MLALLGVSLLNKLFKVGEAAASVVCFLCKTDTENYKGATTLTMASCPKKKFQKRRY
jgi:hypothetical protein